MLVSCSERKRLSAVTTYLVHVLPAGVQWQRHQDGLNPSPRGCQPKLGASVPHQVELCVSASSNGLPRLLLLCELHVFAALQDRHVRCQE